MKNRKESRNLAIAILVLTLVFGFNDKQTAFEMSYWLGNLVRTFLIASIGVLAYYGAQKWMARKLGFDCEFRLWEIRRLGFSGDPSFPKKLKFLGREFMIEALPLGAILAVILMLLTNGRLYFAAVCSFAMIVSHTQRLGKSRFAGPTEMDEAKIAAAGSLALFFLVVLFHALNSREIFGQFILIYSVMTVFQLLPFPGLNGFTILIGSPLTYIFVALFAIVGVVLLHFVSAVIALILGLLVAGIIFFLYLWFRVYK